MSERKKRLAKGLCPNCGKEAAPYYLCDRCHGLNQIRRFLSRMGKEDRVTWDREPHDRRKKRWRRSPRADWSEGITYGGIEFGARAAPRLNRIPVDVERELLGLLELAGKPLHIDEIMAAWGRMRLRRNRESAAGDLACIIEGRRKQAEKQARRLERHRALQSTPAP